MKNSLFLFTFFLASLTAFAQDYFFVESDQDWQNTGYTVIANQPIAFASIGYVNSNYDANNQRFNYHGPSGLIAASTSGGLVENYAKHSLIGRIGQDGTPFGIGEFSIFADGGLAPLTESGDLYLRVNDGGSLSDNDGKLLVWIMPLLNVEYTKVESNQDWQNSDFSVTANTPLAIRAIGYINSNYDANNQRFNYHGPSGLIAASTSGGLVENYAKHSLIGRIGQDGTPFGIGEFSIFADGGLAPLTESGDLYLRVNDGGSLSDNDGNLFVWILELDEVSAINSIYNNPKILIIPNPTKSFVKIEFTSGKMTNYNIELLNINGQLVENFKIRARNSITINLSDLNNGIYIINILNIDNEIITSKKIVKE